MRLLVLIIFFSFFSYLIPYAIADLNDGLIAYYPFNGNANDESGNQNTGFIRGASLIKDRFGNSESAYFFDGKDDYIEVLDSDTLDIKKNISITGWAKVKSFSSEWLGIINKASSDRDDTFEICINKSNYLHFPLMFDSNHRIGYNSSNIFNEGIWHFFAVTYSGDEVKIYIDGALNKSFKSDNKRLNTNSHYLIIGAELESVNGPHHFNGALDDIRIYNRPLNDIEISNLHTINNILLYKKVKLKGTFFQNGWPSAVKPSKYTDIIPTDGIFFPKSHEWDVNTIWWSGLDAQILIDLEQVYWIDSFIVQADDNDLYQISVHKPGNPYNVWSHVYEVPKAYGGGMQTRSQYFIPEPLLADAIKIQAVSGDHLNSIGEIQAFGFKPAVSGCVSLAGNPIIKSNAMLLQSGEIFQKSITDINGCFFFNSVATDKPISIRIRKSE